MTNNLKEIEEPSEGTKLGTYLRVLYCLGYGQGYEDGASKSEMNSNHNKDDYVARIYSDVSALINQKEKEARIDELEVLRQKDPHFFAVCGYHARGENKEFDDMLIANYKLSIYRGDRIKQLKEELKEVV